MKKVKQEIATVLAVVLALQGVPMPYVQAAVSQDIATVSQDKTVATGVNVTYHTQDDIKEYIEASGAKITDAVTFQEDPVTEVPYVLGKLSEQTLDSAIRMLNQIRFIAGIPYDVTLDDSYTEKAQAASLVNYINGEMTHHPTKPKDMTDEMFTLAYSGAGSSNIAYGSGSSWTLNEFLVMSWMEDGNSSNIARVGHRRWLLNPSMKKTGFGLVNGEKRTDSAVYAFDRSRDEAESYGVMWPAQNMPTEYFAKGFPWSISMGRKENESKVHVKLTRNSDGKIWNFSKESKDGVFYVNNTYYGQIGCIIFRPNDIEDYKDGDSYHVEITGLNGEDVSYKVNFFDLMPKTVESVSISPTEATVIAGKTKLFHKAVTVQNDAERTVIWSVEGNKSPDTRIDENGLLTVAEDEEGKILTVKATSTVDETKYGEVQVTILSKLSEADTQKPSNQQKPIEIMWSQSHWL